MALPVQEASLFDKYAGRKVAVSARRLVLEIGYLRGDLPAMLSAEYAILSGDASLSLPQTDDPNAALVPYGLDFMGIEQTSQATIADVNIPCVAMVNRTAD